MMNRTFHIAIIVLISLFVAERAQSQQDPKFNQYMFNPLGINPAYAGSRDVLSAVTLIRNQWVGFEGAPMTQTFAIHGPLVKRKMGLGFQVTNDIIGPRNTINAEVDYAYRFPMLRGKMAFGLSGGVYYHVFHWDKIDYKDGGDIVPNYGVRNAWSPDVDFGAYWNNNKMYFGLELAHLTSPRINILDTNTGAGVSGGNANVYRQFRHISFTAGRAFILSKSVVLKPSLLYKQAGLYRGMFDLNVSVLLNNKLWMGITARSDYGAVLIFEYVINKKIRIGYSFDYPILSRLKLQTQGTSHELFLGYDFGVSRSQTVSPRYF